jgi:superfamily I DNA and RNA helicase
VLYDAICKTYSVQRALNRRQLGVDVRVITFAPVVSNTLESLEEDDLIITQAESLTNYLKNQQLDNSEKYKKIVSAIQAVSKVKVGKKRNPKKSDSRGAKLVKLDQSITNLDLQQSKAVLETVNGVQRIRGLAGSGKTIVLARKVAYLHAKNPDWKIAVTFNTRSLKKQFENLITSFVYEQTNELPNFEKIKIIHAWAVLLWKAYITMPHYQLILNILIFDQQKTIENQLIRTNLILHARLY